MLARCKRGLRKKRVRRRKRTTLTWLEHRQQVGGITFLNDWDYVALNGREVRLVFDSDVMTKDEVRKALERLTEHLQRKGATASAVYLPHDNGESVVRKTCNHSQMDTAESYSVCPHRSLCTVRR